MGFLDSGEGWRTGDGNSSYTAFHNLSLLIERETWSQPDYQIKLGEAAQYNLKVPKTARKLYVEHDSQGALERLLDVVLGYFENWQFGSRAPVDKPSAKQWPPSNVPFEEYWQSINPDQVIRSANGKIKATSEVKVHWCHDLKKLSTTQQAQLDGTGRSLSSYAMCINHSANTYTLPGQAVQQMCANLTCCCIVTTVKQIVFCRLKKTGNEWVFQASDVIEWEGDGSNILEHLMAFLLWIEGLKNTELEQAITSWVVSGTLAVESNRTRRKQHRHQHIRDVQSSTRHETAPGSPLLLARSAKRKDESSEKIQSASVNKRQKREPISSCPHNLRSSKRAQ